jgi:PAS domain S-box-containing protein
MEKSTNATLIRENHTAQDHFQKANPAFFLLDKISSMVAYFDRDLRLHYVNQAFAEWCESGAESLKGKTLYEVFRDEILDQLKPAINDVLSGRNSSLELETFSDGNISCWALELSHCRLQSDEEGFLFHGNDITTKIRAERELRDYVENAAIGLHWVNAEGIITWANSNELEMLGYTKDEYVGHHISEFHADPQVIGDILNRLSNRETLNNYEAKLKCKDGSIRYISINSNVLWERGKFVRTRCFSVDITAKKQLALSLTREEEKFRALMDRLPVAIYTCDTEGKITYFNDVAAELWRSRPELNSDSVKFCAAYKVWLDGKYIAPNETPMAIAIKTGQSFRNLQPVFERPDGTSFNPHVTIDPLYDEEDNICGAINVFQDITELKEVQNALLESELQHKQVLELLPAAVYTCDVEGRVQLFNKAAAELWGREPAIGKDMWCGSWKIFSPEDGSPVELDTCPMAVCLKEGRPVYGAEIVVQRPDGSKRNVAPNPRPIFDSHGKLIGAVNMLLDITEQKIAGRAIKESEERFRMMAELVPIIIWLTDKEGNCSYVNPLWREQTGATIEQALGKGWFSFIHPEEKNMVEKEVQAAIKERSVLDLKFRYLNSKKGFVINHAYCKPRYNENDQYLGHIGIIQDISQQEELHSFLEDEVRVRTNELSQKNLALEKVNQELASFAYVSSHDLQEPLRKIQTFTNRILELDATTLSPKSRDYFERIGGASKRMRALIEDLLAYSRANTAERKFEMRDLNELTDHAVEELIESIEEKGAVIDIQPLPKLKVIPFQFQQLVINILSNALKFSKPDVRPVVVIKADIVDGVNIAHPGAQDERSYHHISFQDNGIGFDPTYNSRIFEVFQRLHSRSEYTGTGIGLSICKKIIENHNGIIAAEGRQNQGATFHIYLPVQ